MTFFADLYTFVQLEPVLEQNKSIIDFLASPGIVCGEPFEPDEALQETVLEGLDCAYDFLQKRFVTEGGGFKTIWPDRKWGAFAINPE